MWDMRCRTMDLGHGIRVCASWDMRHGIKDARRTGICDVGYGTPDAIRCVISDAGHEMRNMECGTGDSNRTRDT